MTFIKKDLNYLSELGPRPAGSAALQQAFTYFHDQLKQLKPARLEYQEFPLTAFRRGHCNITLRSPVNVKLEALSLGFAADAKADDLEVVYAGRGYPLDFSTKASLVKGRVALVKSVAGYHRSKAIKQAQKYGAVGLLIISSLKEGYVQTGYVSQAKKRRKIFGAGISAADGYFLRRLIDKRKRPLINVRIKNEYFPATGRNLVASFGDSRVPAILLTAHLDTWDISPGISDNSSGAATVLAIARLLAGSHVPFKVILFDGEEIGLLGSNDYVSRNDLEMVRLAINFDIVGWPSKITMIGKVDGIKPGQSVKFGNGKEIEVTQSALAEVKYVSDFIPFARQGVPVMLQVSRLSSGRGRYYHSAHDTLANFQPESLVHWPGIISRLLVDVAGVPVVGQGKGTFIRRLFNDICGEYDFLNKVISFGLDNRVRRKTISPHLKDEMVLDMGCGTGDMALQLLKSRGFTGDVVLADFSPAMINAARRKSASAGNVLFVICKAEELPFKTGVFSGVISGFTLRNFVSIEAFAGEMDRVLAPDGHASLVEFSHPPNRVIAALHGLYFYRLLPLIARVFSRRKYAYSYLPASLKAFDRQEKILHRLEQKSLSGAYENILWGAIAIYRLRKAKKED